MSAPLLNKRPESRRFGEQIARSAVIGLPDDIARVALLLARDESGLTPRAPPGRGEWADARRKQEALSVELLGTARSIESLPAPTACESML